MTSYIESIIEQTEFEDKLFESLLNIRFRKAQVIKEADEQENKEQPAEAPAADNNTAPAVDANTKAADSSTIRNIGTKIKEAWDKMINWFIKVGTNIANKIKEIFWKDNKVIEKYSKALENYKETLKGFDGIPDFKPAYLGADLVKEEDFLRLSNACVSPNAENIEKAMEVIKNISKSIETKTKTYFMENQHNPWMENGNDDYDFGQAVKLLKENRISENMIKAVKAAEARCKGVKIAEKFARGNMKEALSMVPVKEMGDACKSFLTANTNYFKAIRRALIVCGSYAVKHSEQPAAETPEQAEAQQTAAESVAYLADLIHQDYMNEQFSFI